jgi:hypothetical protein
MKKAFYFSVALCFVMLTYTASSQVQSMPVSLKSNTYVADMSYDMNTVPHFDLCEVDTSLLLPGISEETECRVFDRMELFIVPVAEISSLLMQTSSTHCLAAWSDVRDNSAFMSLTIGKVQEKSSKRTPSFPAYAAVLVPGTNVTGSTESGMVIAMQYYEDTSRPKPAISGNIYIAAVPYTQNLEPHRLIGVLLKRLPDSQVSN